MCSQKSGDGSGGVAAAPVQSTPAVGGESDRRPAQKPKRATDPLTQPVPPPQTQPLAGTAFPQTQPPQTQTQPLVRQAPPQWGDGGGDDDDDESGEADRRPAQKSGDTKGGESACEDDSDRESGSDAPRREAAADPSVNETT